MIALEVMNSTNVTFAPGQRIGDYQLLMELAAGGTATVGIAAYRGGEDLQRLVVVKRVHRLLTKNEEFTAMLLDEARLASSIRHPNVVSVIDVVRAEDEVILVMDYVESVSLAELERSAERAGQPLPIAVASRILCDALHGLQEAHEAVDSKGRPLGIVHRDMSPQNVIVGVDGVSRVIDFGIAKAATRIAKTRAGIVKGKAAYMSPEQVDARPVDRRSDLFSAGIVLWEALTGKRLFRGAGEIDEMRRVMRAPVPLPSGDNPECSPDVDALLMQALARSPDERFQTARAFAHALEQTIAPAPAQAVARVVTTLCAAELNDRNARLERILGDDLQRLRGHASRRMLSPSLAVVPIARLPRPLQAPSPVASVVPPAPASSSPKARRPLSLIPTLIVVTMVSIALGIAAGMAWLSLHPRSARTPSPAAAPLSR